VDGDGRPLCHNEDEITPDYETIFVKQSDEESKQAVMKNAGDIDVILSQRMSQKTGNSDGTSSPPPQPPPKQRTPVETGAIDSRKVAVTPDEGDSSSERLSSSAMFLYDPPTSNGDASAPGTQKIKKGDLRLTQMENGSWRLEDSDKPQPSSTATTTETTSTTTTTTSTTTSTKFGGKKKKSKDQSNDDNTGSEHQQLLRRPSIKKIRALFQKDKDTSTSSASSKNDSGESEENKEVLAAISKLPKFEPTYGNIVGRSESASMPNSLDRRAGSKPSVLPTTTTTTTSTTSSKVLSSSENKPSLPVKRSKSMKAISKPVSFLFPSNTSVPTTTATTTNNNKQLFKSNSLYLDNYETPTRSDTFPKNSSVTRFDFENLGNLPRRESAGKDLGNVTNFEQHSAANAGLPPPKPMRANSEYANVYMQQPSSDFVSADSVRHRISNYVSSNKSSLSKPDSSNSLNEDAKKMLKDCQDYLVRQD